VPYLQTERQLEQELERACAEGFVDPILAVERRARLPRALLLAIASRETHFRNVAGDGGHGRGVFQIDDRSHDEWLRRHGAGGPGAVPPVEDAAAYAAEILAGNLAYGRSKGLSGDALLRFAVSAYNAGAGGAWRGMAERGDPDARTAHANYGRDVLERMALIRRFLGQPVLRRGDRGAAVLELKRLLRAWFDANGGGPAFKVNANYGAATAKAVEEFQRRKRLDVDGVAGPQTWEALSPTGP
jgi:peptidoglycan hydrolase-like protein with peptidoglycan-binding domain